MTGPQPPYGSPHQEGGESSQELGEAGWFGKDRQDHPGYDDRDETVRTSATQGTPDHGRHAKPAYPAAGPPAPTADVPTSVQGPEATQVISSALEQPAPFQPAQPVSESQSAELYGDATQVVSMSSPRSDHDDDQNQADRFSSDATQVVSPGSMPPPGPPGPSTPSGGIRTGPGGFAPPSGPPQPGGYPQPAPGGPGGGQPGWPQSEQFPGQPGPFGGGPQEPQPRPYGAPGQPPQQGPPPGYGGPRPGQAPPPWSGPQPQHPMGPPPQQGWGGQPPPPPQWGGQQQYGPPPQQQYGAPQPPWGGQPYGQQPGYPGYGQPGISPERLADWPKRAIGGLIDFVGPIIIAYIFYFIAAGAQSTSLLLLSGLLWLGAIGFALYNAYLGGTTGQSIGKKYAKIRLVKDQTGDLIGGGMGILRYLLHAVDGLACGVGYLAPLFTPKKQTFADMIVSTVVVKVD